MNTIMTAWQCGGQGFESPSSAGPIRPFSPPGERPDSSLESVWLTTGVERAPRALEQPGARLGERGLGQADRAQEVQLPQRAVEVALRGAFLAGRPVGRRDCVGLLAEAEQVFVQSALSQGRRRPKAFLRLAEGEPSRHPHGGQKLAGMRPRGLVAVADGQRDTDRYDVDALVVEVQI